MNFIEAVKLAKEGKQIRIPSWSDGVSAYISDLNEEEEFCGLYWKNKDISHLIRFIPNVRSILADDWEIYEEEPKTYSFQEAIKLAKEGKKIRSVNWPRHRFIYVDNEDDEDDDYCWFDEQGDYAFLPDYEKLVSPWEIFEEKEVETYTLNSDDFELKRIK